MTTTAVQGTTTTLLALFTEYPGGPGADVTGLTITIRPAAGGPTVIGPTSTGVVHDATGVYTYGWAVDDDQAAGDYLAIWSGTDADSDVVTAAEAVRVVTSDVDYGTDLGMVRLLIPDTDPTTQILDDTQITAFLTLEGGVKRAAASALETIASNEALVSKVLKDGDLATDGAKLSAELRARAKELRRQADEDDLATAGNLDIIDFVDPFSRWGAEGAETQWSC